MHEHDMKDYNCWTDIQFCQDLGFDLLYLHYFAAFGGDGVDRKAAVPARPHARSKFWHDVGRAERKEKEKKAKDRARGEKRKSRNVQGV